MAVLRVAHVHVQDGRAGRTAPLGFARDFGGRERQVKWSALVRRAPFGATMTTSGVMPRLIRACERRIDRVAEAGDDLLELGVGHDERRRQQHVVAPRPSIVPPIG